LIEKITEDRHLLFPFHKYVDSRRIWQDVSCNGGPMAHNLNDATDTYVLTENPDGQSPVVLVCEHASHYIPAQFDGLGLSDDARHSHAAWDPGAMGVALLMAKQMDAALVASGVSRLVYDCNRPPTAIDAMPARS